MLNGVAQEPPRSGTYYSVTRRWNPGDQIDLSLDFSPHYWVGDRECRGKVSMYRGPLLLTWDRRFNDSDPASVPALDSREMPGTAVEWKGSLKPLLLLEHPTRSGKTVQLCDFASAGQAGSPYRSWLEIANVTAIDFSRANPLRSGRLNSQTRSSQE